MPIRFRCVYCDKLLGIATRKAGTVVNCPQCGQPLIVPTPEPESEPAPVGPKSAPAHVPSSGPTGNMFEEDDFDVLLEADATVQAAPEPPSQPRRKTSVKPPAPSPMSPRPYAPDQRAPSPGGSQQYAPLPLPTPAQPKGMVLTGGKIILLIAAIGFLMLVAFGAGMFAGRMLWKGE